MSTTTKLEPGRKVRLTMREGARRVPCSDRQFYNLAYAGEIPTYVVAGHRWVDEEDIDAYIARCKAAGPQFNRAIGYGTGKRRPGRPKHPKPEPSSAAAE